MESLAGPIFDAAQMRATDAWAIEEKEIPSLDLMEVAGRAVAEAAAEICPQGPARVVCGKGNNGGDGLVAARVLSEMGFEVEALLLAASDELSADSRAAYERFPTAKTMAGDGLPAALEGAGVVIDAIFGTGFEAEPREPAAGAIDAINACKAPVVAVDIASGVNASTGEAAEHAVDAALTVSFHAAKVGHWVNPGKSLSGEVRVADIGIPSGAPVAANSVLLHPAMLAAAPRRQATSTKFSSGSVVVIGGSKGLTGSVCLAAEAGIRAGAGYATVAVPAELETIFELKLTEVMSVGLPSRDGHLRPAAAERALESCKRAGAVLLGPGLGGNPGAAGFAQEVALRIEAPLVVDADGLNAHAGSVSNLAGRGAATVLTPHEGELARLLGAEPAEVSAHRLACARAAAKQSRSVVVLKGDDTIVTDGERVAINPLASPGLATAGTGDVLGGMIVALIARGMDVFDAAGAAVLAHARAGRAAAQLCGAESVIASDVIREIPVGLRDG